MLPAHEVPLRRAQAAKASPKAHLSRSYPFRAPHLIEMDPGLRRETSQRDNLR